MAANKTTKKKSTKKSSRTTTAKKKASPKAGSSSRAKSKPTKAGEQEITIDRRQADRRDDENQDASIATPERRQKVQRRRQIDPTTCERDYSSDEVEFMNAMDEYKRTSGRMFPTCSEVLEVIRELGYVRLSPAELALQQSEGAETTHEADAEGSIGEEELESSLESEEMATNGWAI